MKGKYITKQIRLACLTVPAASKKSIHEQLEETLNERRKIMKQFQNMVRVSRVIDMYLGITKAA